ncbi:MAG: chalcone isomerase family protein [Acidobacteriia bacterium]|nr:chalcone isomerase family protein [Terriglobia bacterium]
MRGASYLLIGVALLAPPAIGGELSGVSLPDRASVGGKALVLNGMGLRKAYGFAKVYVAGLYLEKKTASAEEILGSDTTRRIELRFVRHVSRDDIVKAWTEGFEKNAARRLGALEDRLDTLNGTMRDLEPGDVLAFSTVPDKGVLVEVGGQPATTIPGADFARTLLAIWLGPDPPNAALKAGLLGAR